MPYIIKKVNNGFKVCKKTKPSECYSNKPLTKKMAMKQRTAINLSELGLSKPKKLLLMRGRGVVLLGSYNGTPNAPIQKGMGMFNSKLSASVSPTNINKRKDTKKLIEINDGYKRGLALADYTGDTSPLVEMARKDLKKNIEIIRESIPGMLKRKIGKGKSRC
jgi:hypothetical protein